MRDGEALQTATVARTAEPGARSNLIGIGLMVAAVGFFSCLDATTKWLSHSLTPAQMLFGRYFFSLLMVAAIFNPKIRPGVWRTKRPGLQIARGLLLVGSSTCAFVALHYLQLGQFTSIAFSAPLIVAGIAGPLLGERIGWRRMLAVLVGFCGVLVVARPGPGMHPAALLAIGAAAFNSVYMILTRRLAATDAPDTTLSWTCLVGTVAALPLVPFTWTHPADPMLWLGLVAMAAFGTLGHGLLTLAHRYATASTLAPFFYVQLFWATLLGIIVFGSFPDSWTITGGSIVLASGLYLLWRERVRAAPPSACPPSR